MRALMSISDRVMVMNHGRLLFQGTPDDVQRHEEVIRVYLGTATEDRPTRADVGAVEELEDWRTSEPDEAAGSPEGDSTVDGTMLEVRNVRAAYGQTRVLEGVDLDGRHG